MPNFPLRDDNIKFAESDVLFKFRFGMKHVEIHPNECLIMMVKDNGNHIPFIFKYIHSFRDKLAGHATLEDDRGAIADSRYRFVPMAFGMSVQDGGTVLITKFRLFGNIAWSLWIFHIRV
jgi:hypothetical protein